MENLVLRIKAFQVEENHENPSVMLTVGETRPEHLD
jgi:hypothetical protein